MQAVQVLLDNNVREDRIIFLNLISAPEGIEAFVKRFPQIKIITGEIDGGCYVDGGIRGAGCNCRYGIDFWQFGGRIEAGPCPARAGWGALRPGAIEGIPRSRNAASCVDC